MDNFYRRKILGLLFLATYGLMFAWVQHTHRQAKADIVINYLKSPQFIRDFYQPEPLQQEVLVVYPKIMRYFTNGYLDSPTISETLKQEADESQCDVIYELFQKLHARQRDKAIILATLKTQNIELEQIYRNKYAEVIYRTNIVLKNCPKWYENGRAPDDGSH